MLHLYVSESWILSPLARRVYLVCAILALTLFVIFIAGRMTVNPSGSAPGNAVPMAFFVRLIVLAGILGTAILSVAMWYFWFGFDRSSWIKKALWLPMLYLFFAIGPALYYFFVYRKNESVRNYSISHEAHKLAGASLS